MWMSEQKKKQVFKILQSEQLNKWTAGMANVGQ
jgi:hypothetical protein